jgi:hypothetical protein
MSKRSFFLPVILAASVGCADLGDLESTSAGLVIELADEVEGLRAHAEVDGERIDVVARDQDDVRTVVVSGAHDHVYAEWTIDSGDIVGTIGGKSFGRAEDAVTDLDPTYWSELADSRAEAVLAQISVAAEELVDDPALAAVEHHLDFVADMSAFLAEMMEERVEEVALSANLLRNGGFESGSSSNAYYWTQRNANRTSRARYRGSFGMRIYGTKNTYNSAGQSVSAAPGRRYQLSAVVRRVSGTYSHGGTMGLHFDGASGLTIRSHTLNVTSKSWRTRTLTATAPSGTVRARVSFTTNHALGTFDADQVSIRRQ